ncbi:anthrone oxygenase family protein [Salana multivorans]
MRSVHSTWAVAFATASVLWFGAVFGFFFAWVCSTLWGLDSIDPRAAIEAMNGMNASVRNPVFFTAFFLTPLVGAVAAVLCWACRARAAALLLGLAVLAHVLGVIVFTQAFNLPLNASLAAGGVPATQDEARIAWAAFSGPWQTYNLVRAVVSGVGLTLAASALFLLGRHSRPRAS